jgi:hypothetical protein
MEITQEIVDKIIKRAEDSPFGLNEGLTYKQGHLQISTYADKDLDALAMLLVNGYHSKYDLISVFAAALKTVADMKTKEKFE